MIENLMGVTFTGADDRNDQTKMLELSARYRGHLVVEFGVLIGNSESARFPSRAWIDRLVDLRAQAEDADEEENTSLSLHLCGRYLSEIAHGRPSISSKLTGWSAMTKFDRLQFNWHGGKMGPRVNVQLVQSLVGFYPWRPVLVFQLDGVNDEIWRPAADYGFTCQGLFDTSHGAGVTPESWPARQPDLAACGWAGGLGRDNLESELPKIAEKSDGLPFWVDMETKVCGADGLDLEEVEACLEICENLVG